MCFNISSFYGFTLNTLSFKELKSPVNRNWSSVYLLSLSPMEILLDQFLCSIISTFKVYRYFHSFESWLWHYPCRYAIWAESPWQSLKSLVLFYGFTTVNGIHPHLFPVNSSRFTLVERLSLITGISVLPVSRYQIFSIRICWCCRLHRYSTILILLLSLYVDSFFYFWPFYSVGSFTKK
jgi:hypothetical protein